jgi:hypothetical protein
MVQCDGTHSNEYFAASQGRALYVFYTKNFGSSMLPDHDGLHA